MTISTDERYFPAPIDHALRMVGLGARVFPLDAEQAKRPIPGLSWLKLRTRNPEKIKAQLRARGTYAVATGDGFLVVDVDVRDGKQGDATFEEVDMMFGFPDTFTVQTATGGRHLYYRTPPAMQLSSDTKGRVVGPGIDIKAHHGYVVGPGSETPRGEYKVLDARAPVDAPQWLIDKCGEEIKRPANVTEPLCEWDLPANIERARYFLRHEAPPALQDENGDETTLTTAMRVRDYAISESLTLDLMLDHYNERCEPPWDPEDMAVKVANGYRYAKNRPGSRQAGVYQFDDVSQFLETPKKALIQSSRDFILGFVPPDYLIDGLIQRRFIYSVTAPTGAGKTALMLLLAALTALGKPLGDRPIEPGRVLYFAGENPDDVRMRWIAMADSMGFDTSKIDVHFIPGAFSIPKLERRIREEIAALGGAALVIVDTSAAYFQGDEENSNVQLGNHARQLRNLTTLPGEPCVLVASHPTKSPDQRNLLPRGGGAFLAEVDGNLVCLKQGNVIDVHWHGKFRGPDFSPIGLQLLTATCSKLRDSKGRDIPTVMARPLSEAKRSELEHDTRRREDRLLLVLNEGPQKSMGAIAKLLGWSKAAVQRTLNKLRDEKLVVKRRERWEITKKGREEADVLPADVAGDEFRAG